MKNRKKFLALGLGLAMSIGLLAACAPAAAPAADSPAAWTSAADLEGKKIAVQEGTTGNDAATAIEGAEVSAFKAATACALELINGRVDCVVIDTNPAQALVNANADKLTLLSFPASAESETYAIAAQKNDTGAALVAEFNTAMKTLKENGTFDALVAKYISKDESAVLPELPAYTAKGALVMGTNCEFEPFEFLTSDGTPTGFDVDYVKYLCATMGYDVTVENMDFDALIPAMGSGRVDFIAAGLTKTAEREANANFTDGYYEATQAIIVKK